MNITNQDRIAVIMSIYKNDIWAQVEESINSILLQTYKAVDIYIMCDGPVEQNIEKNLCSYECDNFYVKRHETNLGLASSLNDLLDIVLKKNYNYIARMDADDISITDRFEKQVLFLKTHPEVDMVGGAICEINLRGEKRGKIVKYPCTPEECLHFFSKRNPVAHPTVMFRRSFFKKTGCLYPTDFIRNEDTRLWHEGYKHGCVIANISDVVLNFRVTDNMFKQRRNGKMFAKSQLKLRKVIANDLNFVIVAYVYAYITYFLMISPSWVLKLAYKYLR